MIPGIINTGQSSGGKCSFCATVSRNLSYNHSRICSDTLQERLNTNVPEDNDDILENHISDRQESLEVKVAAPILARLHFLTINVFGSCQFAQVSHYQIRHRDPNMELNSELRPRNFRPKNGTVAGENGS